MKRSEIGPALLAMALAFTVVFALSEIALRIYTSRVIDYDVEMTRYSNELKQPSPDPRIGHVHRPGRSAVLMGVPVSINRAGLRDRDYPEARNAARRIAFLGDSLTFGWGVEKPATFEALLERALGAREPTEVLDFGTGNYNTEQQVHHFLRHGLRFAPDHVVVFFFINDAEPTPARSRWAFLGHSRLATFVWSRLKKLRSRLLPGRSYAQYYAALYGDGQPGWRAAREAFSLLARSARERGMGLSVVLLPELHEPAHMPFAAQHRKLAAFLAQQGIAVRDLAPDFRDETDPRSLWVAPDDAHPNARAHAKIAERVLPWLEQRLRESAAAAPAEPRP